MKKYLSIVLALMMVLGLTLGCVPKIDLDAHQTDAAATEEAAPVVTSEESTEAATEAPKLKVGVMFTTSGLGDNNFNDMVYAGLRKAQDELGITFDYAEPTSTGEMVQILYDFAKDGSYDLIISLSAESASAMEEVSAQYPEQNFEIIDAAVQSANVRSLVKSGAEQIFLTGVIAGLLTEDTSYAGINDAKKVGAVLGMDLPMLRAMAAGYSCGARYYDRDVEVVLSTVGDFGDVNKGKEMALAMYEQGVDVIQNLQGAGTGIFTAAEEKNFLCLGAGANQNKISPDHIVATAGFVLTNLVYNDCKAMIEGTWEAGTYNPGLRDGAFEYLMDESNIVLSETIIQKVEDAQNWFISSTAQLPTDTDQVDAWLEANGK